MCSFEGQFVNITSDQLNENNTNDSYSSDTEENPIQPQMAVVENQTQNAQNA